MYFPTGFNWIKLISVHYENHLADSITMNINQSSKYIPFTFSSTSCQFVVVALLVSSFVLLCSSRSYLNVNMYLYLPACLPVTSVHVCMSAYLHLPLSLGVSINQWNYPPLTVCIWVLPLLPLSLTLWHTSHKHGNLSHRCFPSLHETKCLLWKRSIVFTNSCILTLQPTRPFRLISTFNNCQLVPVTAS